MNKFLKKIFVPLSIFTIAIGAAFAINNLNEGHGAKAEEVSVTLNNIGAGLTTTTNTSVKTTTVNDYVLNYYQAKKQTSGTYHAIFLAKSVSPFISNKTATPAPIKSVGVGIFSGAAGATTYRVSFGASEFLAAGTSGTAVNITGGNSHVFTNSGTSETYFVISLGNANNGQVHWIKIVYETQQSTEPELLLDKSSVKLLPNQQTSLTATASNFIPTTYSWTKDDPSSVLVLDNITSATVTITSTSNLGSATLIVEASDGTTSKQQSIIVSVSEIPEGKYTISSNSTNYTNPMTISQFNIVKELPDLDNLSISDISDIRAGASPNTSHIAIGGSSTVGGSFKLTLPEGLYAVSIKFTGLVVDVDKTPTLAINNGVSFKYASGMTEATLYPYSNTLTITTSPSRIWVSAIEIEAKTAGNAAIDFGTNFLTITDAECLLANVQSGTWTKIQTSYAGMDADVKAIIESSTINNSGNDLEKALGRYEFICAKYGYNDFISGTTSPQGNLFTNKTNEGGLIIIISLLSITSLGTYYYLRKKRSLI